MSDKYIVRRQQWVVEELQDEEFIGPFDTSEEAKWWINNKKYDRSNYWSNDVIQLRTVK